MRTFAAVVALWIAAAAPTAWAQPVHDTDRTDPPVFDTDAHPEFRWAMPKRWQASWDSYKGRTRTYDEQVVNPKSWRLDLDACASTSVHAITSYKFKVTQDGTGWTTSITSPDCLAHVDGLPALGGYDVRLILVTDWSPNIGVSTPKHRPVLLRDLLIVSMGDSLASGEGNPDVRGEYVLGDTIKKAEWKDEPCHRSALSGPSLAAKAIEDASWKTSVTFVSVACSGALIDDLYVANQNGRGPQVRQVQDLFGARAPNGRRTIDAILVTAGLNDLHFHGVISRCADPTAHGFTHTVHCVHMSDRLRDLAGLPASYRKLSVAIREELTYGQVFLNDYPSHVFKGGGNGDLFLITAAKGRAMATVGQLLNDAIKTAVDRYSSGENRWGEVGDLDGPFYHHAYADSDTWFTHHEWSKRHQGDESGTAHPNGAGHRAFAAILVKGLASVITP